MPRPPGDLSAMELLDYCPQCDEPLYLNPAARPPAKLKPLAIMIILGALALWPVLQVIFFLLLRIRGPVTLFLVFIGPMLVSAAIGGFGLRMPRNRKFRCRACGWTGIMQTNWQR